MGRQRRRADTPASTCDDYRTRRCHRRFESADRSEQISTVSRRVNRLLPAAGVEWSSTAVNVAITSVPWIKNPDVEVSLMRVDATPV